MWYFRLPQSSRNCTERIEQMGDGGGVFRINVTFPNWDPPNAKEKEQDNSTSLCDQHTLVRPGFISSL